MQKCAQEIQPVDCYGPAGTCIFWYATELIFVLSASLVWHLAPPSSDSFVFLELSEHYCCLSHVCLILLPLRRVRVSAPGITVACMVLA